MKDSYKLLLIRKFIYKSALFSLGIFGGVEFFISPIQAMMNTDTSTLKDVPIISSSIDDSTVDTSTPSAEPDTSMQGIEFYIHYVPGTWKVRQSLRNSIVEQIPPSLKDIGESTIKSLTSMHITMGWGNIIPLTCSTPEPDSCKFTPVSKKPLSTISKLFNQLTNKKGKQIIEQLRYFRSFFHRGSRYYFLDHFTLDLEKLRSLTMSIHEAINKRFMLSEIPDFQKPDLKTFDAVISFLHKNIAFITQEMVNNLPRYGTDRILTELFEYTGGKEESKASTICNGYISTALENQRKITAPIAETIDEIKSILRDNLKEDIYIPKRLASNKEGKDYDTYTLEKITDWDLHLSKQEPTQALKKCTKFLEEARTLKLEKFYNDLKENFINSYAGVKFKFNDSLSAFKGSERKILITAQVTPDNEQELRSRYISVLKKILPKRFHPEELPPIDCKKSSRGLDYFNAGDKRDFSKKDDLKTFKLKKRYCLKESPENCFMIVAHREFYNGECPFNYHITVVSDELAPVKGETSQKDIRNKIHNEDLILLKKFLLDPSFKLTSSASSDEDNWNNLDKIGGDNLHFYNPLVHPLPLVGTEIPRVDEEIKDDNICLWQETACKIIPKKEALELAKSKAQHLIEIDAGKYPPLCQIGPIVDRTASDKIIFTIEEKQDLENTTKEGFINHTPLTTLLSSIKTPTKDIIIEFHFSPPYTKDDFQIYVKSLLESVISLDKFDISTKKKNDGSKIFVTLSPKSEKTFEVDLTITPALQATIAKNSKSYDEKDISNIKDFISNISKFKESSTSQMNLRITFDDLVEKSSRGPTTAKLKTILTNKNNNLKVDKNINASSKSPHFTFKVTKKNG